MTSNAARSTNRRARGGFTLTEIMIALGVLVTGMSMVAGALHAGIQNHVTTVDDIVRSIIAENAMATIKARMRYDGTAKSVDTFQIVGDSTSYTGLGPQDRRSPTGGIPTNYGFYIAENQITSKKNDCRYTIVPYKVVPGDNADDLPDAAFQNAFVNIQTASTVTIVSDTTNMVTKVTYRTRSDASKFAKNAKVIVTLASGVSTGTVDKSVGTTTVQLKELMTNPSTGAAVSGTFSTVTTLTVSGTNADKADINVLDGYQCRTSLPAKK